MNPSNVSTHKTRRRLAVAGLLLALAAAFWFWPRARPADAVQVSAQPLQRSLQFSARVQSRARVDVGSTLTGRVAEVRVREGDNVAADAPLLTLESDELRSALTQARANLRQAQARTLSQRRVGDPSARAALAQAEASLTAAERELERTRTLLAANFVSAARLDDARRVVDIARAQRDAAQANASANASGGSEADGAQAQQAAAQAAVQAAQARLAQATLSAPGAGQVIQRQVEPGQIVQPGRALLTMVVNGPTELVALVDERFLSQLQVGQMARVVADAYPGQAFDARLLRLAPAVDALRGAVEVTFAVPQVPAFLREDMTLSVEVVTGAREAAIVLPLRALKSSLADRAVVLVVEDGHARAREVQLGLRTLDQVEVTSGLAKGETVLLDPTLPAGQKVRARLLDAADAQRQAVAGTSGADGITSAMGAGASR